MMFNIAINRNKIGFPTKNENTPINSCKLDEKIIVGATPIKIHNRKAKKPKIIRITPLRRENVLFIPEEIS